MATRSHAPSLRTWHQAAIGLLLPSAALTTSRQLTDLFARLTTDFEIWRSLTSRYDADLFCGVFIAWFGHGFSMSPALHRALADRNLLITFDIYPEYDRNA